MAVIGIDIGGTGIKGAPVDTTTGELTRERVRIPTPEGATPAAVAQVVGEIVRELGGDGRFGATFPAVVRRGVALSAANVDTAWIGTDIEALLTGETGRPCTAMNDADAAGVAEVRFGAGRDVRGTVLLLTLGTGIGSALFVDGHLVPNTELGHLEIRGKSAEHRASERAREEGDLGWGKWAKRLNEALAHYEALLWPDLIILGGGVSKKADRFLHHLDTRAPVVPAALRNDAGIVGAALAAHEHHEDPQD